MEDNNKNVYTNLIGLVCVIAVSVAMVFFVRNDPMIEIRMIAGAAMGLITGCVAKYFLEKKYVRHELVVNILWICLISGLLGGIVLTIPVALVIWFLAHRKNKKMMESN